MWHAFFIFGLALGSFLGVIIDRAPRGEQILRGRSRCDFCKHTLGVFDLIPVFSWVFLGGRCRYCHKKLSAFYPLVELTTGGVFALVAYGVMGMYGVSFIELIYWLALASILIVVFFADIRFGIIPDAVVFPGIGLVLLRRFVDAWFFKTDMVSPLLTSLVAFSLFFLIVLLTRGRGMGLGDVKYAAFMGLLLGFPGTVYALYIAFLTGAFASVILIVGKKRKWKQTIPFGPFLVVGTVATLLFYSPIESFVRRLF